MKRGKGEKEEEIRLRRATSARGQSCRGSLQQTGTMFLSSVSVLSMKLKLIKNKTHIPISLFAPFQRDSSLFASQTAGSSPQTVASHSFSSQSSLTSTATAITARCSRLAKPWPRIVWERDPGISTSGRPRFGERVRRRPLGPRTSATSAEVAEAATRSSSRT